MPPWGFQPSFMSSKTLFIIPLTFVASTTMYSSIPAPIPGLQAVEIILQEPDAIFALK